VKNENKEEFGIGLWCKKTIKKEKNLSASNV
jgi:hypothetical protein